MDTTKDFTETNRDGETVTLQHKSRRIVAFNTAKPKAETATQDHEEAEQRDTPRKSRKPWQSKAKE